MKAIAPESRILPQFKRNANLARPTPHGKPHRHLSAGTSDLFVAEEARVTAEIMGNETDLIQDVGVAGLHRLLSQQERLAGNPRRHRMRWVGRRVAPAS